MASRSNACAELTRFWLEARHGCLLTQNLPVPVPYGLSDIDFVAMQASISQFTLPNGDAAGPRLIVETKDEHDFDPSGKAFATSLSVDVGRMMDGPFIPDLTKHEKFSMFRQSHFDKALEIFGTTEFDRLFVVHALDETIRAAIKLKMNGQRIHVVTITEVLHDLRDWYATYPRPTRLRFDPVGDVWHLLFGFAGAKI